MRGLLLTAAAAGVLAAGAAKADDPGRTVAGAGGRFLTSIQSSGAASGFSAAQTAVMRGHAAKAAELLRSVPSVSNPQPPACALIFGREGPSIFGRVVAASIAVTTPEVEPDGSCGVKTEMSTAIHLNQPLGLPGPRSEGGSGGGHWEMLPIVTMRPGYLELPDRVYFHESRAELVSPVSAERYAREQLRQLTDGGRHDGGPLAEEWTRRLQVWSATERASDACLDADLLFVSPDNACALDRRAYEFNKDFFDTSRPSDVQVVGFHYPDAHSIESAASWSVREPIPRMLDRQALAGLLARP